MTGGSWDNVPKWQRGENEGSILLFPPYDLREMQIIAKQLSDMTMIEPGLAATIARLLLTMNMVVNWLSTITEGAVEGDDFDRFLCDMNTETGILDWLNTYDPALEEKKTNGH